MFEMFVKIQPCMYLIFESKVHSMRIPFLSLSAIKIVPGTKVKNLLKLKEGIARRLTKNS